jgi:hypothetical protein
MLFSNAFAQQKSIHIKKTIDEIKIDGELNEKSWEISDVATNFVCNFPNDTAISQSKTEARILYAHDGIYVSFKCLDGINGNYIVQSLKRDYSYPVSDAVGVILDPFDDKTNGFAFGVNPYGAQREGLVANGGMQGVSTDWDNLWFSATKKYADHWVAEMFIPYRTIRFKEGLKEWGVNFTRNDLKRNQSSCWSRVGQAYNIATLAFTGKLIWDESPKRSSKTNVSLIPYMNFAYFNDYTKKTDSNIQFNKRGIANPQLNSIPGVDAKVALSSSLNLDITINPDFSHVEVDRQVTNISRFDIFYPERRNFFIENSDLFATFGFTQIRPFYSRRIGIDGSNFIPILGGFRVSGKPNKNWRIGLMTMQTEGVSSLNIRSANYSVAAVQRKLFTRSNISMIAVNKMNYNQLDYIKQSYNSVLGLDYNLSSANNIWTGKAFYHYNFTPNFTGNNMANATWLNYKTRKLSVSWNHEFVGKNYRPEVGFVPRNQVYNPVSKKTEFNSYYRLEPSIYYYFYPKSKWMNHYGPFAYSDYYLSEKFNVTDLLLQGGCEFYLNNSATFSFSVKNNYTRLLYDADVTRSKRTPLAKGEYSYVNSTFYISSNVRKLLNGNITYNAGQYYSGTRHNISAVLNYRWQPYAIFSLTVNYERIKLPHLNDIARLLLLSPKAEFAFTKSFFFTTFLQYNSQTNNFNINSRLQWRFRPMSDLYIVYTDNYNTLAPEYSQHQLLYTSPQNKAIAIKLVWWLNI